MIESWKDIPGFEGIYQASNVGNIRSTRFNPFKILKQHIGTNGYKRVKLNIGGKKLYKEVHRLVALTFIDNTNEVVMHIDDNKLNNNLDNLKWATYKENSNDAYVKGLTPKPPTWKNKKGYNHNRSIEIQYYDLDKSYIKSFGSMSEASRNLGCSVSTISSSIKNNNGKTKIGYFQLSKKKQKILCNGRVYET